MRTFLGEKYKVYITTTQSWTRIGFIHGLDWIGSDDRSNCLETEIFRDSKLDWPNKLWLYFSFFSVCSSSRLL